MPSPRIYPVTPNNGSGPDYSVQISALNDAVASLQQGLSDEASSRGQADVALAGQIDTTNENLNTLSGQVQTLSEAVSNIEAYNPHTQRVTITGPITADMDITLDFMPIADSMEVEVTSGPELYENDDYELSGTTLTLKASSPLVAVLSNGDVLVISYSH